VKTTRIEKRERGKNNEKKNNTGLSPTNTSSSATNSSSSATNYRGYWNKKGKMQKDGKLKMIKK
jgi:hypothetical protein